MADPFTLSVEPNQIKVEETVTERRLLGLMKRQLQREHLFYWSDGEISYRCNKEAPVTINVASQIATFVGEPLAHSDAPKVQARLRISYVDGDDDIIAFSQDMPAHAVTRIVDHLNHVLHTFRVKK